MLATSSVGAPAATALPWDMISTVSEALCFFDVVRRHQDRRPLGAQRVDQGPQLLAHLRIEADGRLVEQHERGPVDERPCDQQAAPHPAGELVDAAVAAVDEVRHGERALDRRPPVTAADPVEVREDEQVLLDGQRHVQVVELRRDAELRAACFDSSGKRNPSTSSSPSSAIACAVRSRIVVDFPRRSARAARHTCHRNVEVETVHGGDRAVAPDRAAQADGELTHGTFL